MEVRLLDNYKLMQLWDEYDPYHIIYLDDNGHAAETLSDDAPQSAWDAFKKAREYMLSPEYEPIR